MVSSLTSNHAASSLQYLLSLSLSLAPPISQQRLLPPPGLVLILALVPTLTVVSEVRGIQNLRLETTSSTRPVLWLLLLSSLAHVRAEGSLRPDPCCSRAIVAENMRFVSQDRTAAPLFPCIFKSLTDSGDWM